MKTRRKGDHLLHLFLQFAFINLKCFLTKNKQRSKTIRWTRNIQIEGRWVSHRQLQSAGAGTIFYWVSKFAEKGLIKEHVQTILQSLMCLFHAANVE